MAEIKAELNYLRIAPRKVRVAVDLIRGKSVAEAENQLRFLTKRSSAPLLKLLKSAVANAEHNFNLKKENLRISKITVDGGPVLKRMRPRAFGRAFQILKRTSHVSFILVEEAASKGVKKTAVRKLFKPVLRESSEKETEIEEKKQTRHDFKEKTSYPKRAVNVIRRVFNRKAV